MLFWKKTVVVLAIAILIPCGSAFAATTAEQDALANAVVNLYCRIKTAGRTYNTTGSGVFVHERGVILTNAHVGQYFLFGTSTRSTKAECSVRQGSPAREKYKAELIYISPSWAKQIVETTQKQQPKRGTGESDFALLRVTSAKKGKLPERFPAAPVNLFALPFKDGEEVSVAGYPADGLKFKEIQQKLKYSVASSTITAIQSFMQPHQDSVTIAGTELSAPGVSGGPIVRSGALAGIAVTISGNSGKGNPSLRAITLPYIDRALRAETGFSFVNAISIPGLRLTDPSLPVFTELRQTIEKSLRNTRE